MILVDSNILVRFANPDDPLHRHVDELIKHLGAPSDKLCIVPQNLYEFWCVASRPGINNGLNMSTSEIQTAKRTFSQLFKFLPDHPQLFDEWERLVIHYHCKGKVCHDARLVATMLLHGIRRLLTFNTADFARFQDRIEIVDAAPIPQP